MESNREDTEVPKDGPDQVKTPGDTDVEPKADDGVVYIDDSDEHESKKHESKKPESDDDESFHDATSEFEGPAGGPVPGAVPKPKKKTVATPSGNKNMIQAIRRAYPLKKDIGDELVVPTDKNPPYWTSYSSREMGGARDFTEKLRGAYAGMKGKPDDTYDLEFSDFQNMCEVEGYRECFSTKVASNFKVWENKNEVNKARVAEWRRILWRAGYQVKGYPRPPMPENIDAWITRKPPMVSDLPLHLRVIDFFNDTEDPGYNVEAYNKKLSQKRRIVSMPYSEAEFNPMVKPRKDTTTELYRIGLGDPSHKYSPNKWGSYMLEETKKKEPKTGNPVKSVSSKAMAKGKKKAKYEDTGEEDEKPLDGDDDEHEPERPAKRKPARKSVASNKRARVNVKALLDDDKDESPRPKTIPISACLEENGLTPVPSLPCDSPGCGQAFHKARDLAQHIGLFHPELAVPDPAKTHEQSTNLKAKANQPPALSVAPTKQPGGSGSLPAPQKKRRAASFSARRREKRLNLMKEAEAVKQGKAFDEVELTEEQLEAFEEEMHALEAGEI